MALRAVADPRRRSILQAVRAGPRSVGEIVETMGLSPQGTSHHLASWACWAGHAHGWDTSYAGSASWPPAATPDLIAGHRSSPPPQEDE